MTLGRVAFKSIDEPSLGRAEEEPVTPGLLQRDEELLTTVHCFLVDVVAAHWSILCPGPIIASESGRPTPNLRVSADEWPMARTYTVSAQPVDATQALNL